MSSVNSLKIHAVGVRIRLLFSLVQYEVVCRSICSSAFETFCKIKNTHRGIDSDFSCSISDSGNASLMIDGLYWKDAWTEAGSVLSAALAASRSTSGDHNGKSRLCSDIVSKVSVNVIE